MSTPRDTGTTDSSIERADLLESLNRHRDLLRVTVRELTEEQARSRPTPSTLTLGGLIKHVADTEAQWVDFMMGGAETMDSAESGSDEDWSGADGEWDEAPDWVDTRFIVAPGTTLTDLLRHYDEVARRTDALVMTLDLDAAHPLPAAPWFEPGARWSTRRVLLHIIAETAQHAGHADIIRESIDGAKSMG